MKRLASFSITSVRGGNHKRTALSTADRISIDPSKLYLSLDALHWEQTGPATTQEKKLYGVSHAYAGNQNGDFFEGGRNVVWACRNERCSNKQDRKWRQGVRRFLKYDGKEECPHCASKDIFNWERETFQTDGELLARTQDGRYRYETWKGEPVNINHDDKRVIGQIEDVWPEPPKHAIVELISIDREGKHGNQRLAAQLESGRVDSGSMELLTGIGLCSVCFNVHTSEDEFCEHLQHEKGLVNQRTGMHVFEICKSIQGCGHAIIATGDPADSGALVRNVFAEKKPQDAAAETTLNRMATSAEQPFEGKPDFTEARSAARVKPNLERLGRRAEADGPAPQEKPLPQMNDMAAQMKGFGNYDSTRSAEQVRLANMTPEERRDHEDMLAWREAQRTGKSAAVSTKPTLRVDRQFVAAVLKRAVQTKKLVGRRVATALFNLTAERSLFIEGLGARKQASGAIQRLAARRAQITSDEDVQEMVIDLVADALIGAGEAAKSLVNDSTYHDVADSAEELVGNPADEADFTLELEGDEPTVEHTDDAAAETAEEAAEASEHAEPDGDEADAKPFKPEDEPPAEPKNKPSENDDDKSSDSADDDMNQPTKKNASAGIAGTESAGKPESFPKSTPVDKPEKLVRDSKAGSGSTNGKPEEFPATPESKAQKTSSGSVNDGAVLTSLTRRKAQLEQQIENGSGDLDQLLPELQKVTAQMERLQTESGPPASKALGGGLDENPKGVAEPSTLYGKDVTKNGKPEKAPQSGTDLGGNGISENFKKLTLAELKRQAGIPESFAWDNLSQVQRNSVELTLLRTAGATTSMDHADIAMLKKMGVWPGDAKTAGKREADGLGSAEMTLKSESFPESKAGVTVNSQGTGETIGKPEEFPAAQDANGSLKVGQAEGDGEGDGEGERQAQATKPYDDAARQQNKGVGTKTTVQDQFEHTIGKPTKSLDDQMKANQNISTPTKPGAAAKAQDKALDRSGTGFDDEPDGGVKQVVSDADQDENLGRTTPTKVGDATKQMEKNRPITASSKITAQFTEVTEKGQASASHWTVLHDEEPILRVALRDAFPGQVLAMADTFASEEYAHSLVEATRQLGAEKLSEETFGGAAKVFTPEERVALRKAQTQPAAQNVQMGQPANVDPAVSDKILNDAKPGISVLDLLASLAAPIIVESDTLSTTNFIEELVNLAQSQDKVTELTTKLNASVQQLKTSSGLPEEANAPAPEAGGVTTPGAAPAAPAGPPMPAQNPQIVQALRKAQETEAKYAQKLQEMRIVPLVQEEQASGQLDGYATFHAAGKSRKVAAEMAREVAQKRVAELLALPEEAFLAVEREIKAACRKARELQSKLPDAREAESLKRRARFDEMKKAAGGHTIKTLPGSNLQANEGLPKKSIRLSFKVAGGIDPGKVAEQRKARDERDGRTAPKHD